MPCRRVFLAALATAGFAGCVTGPQADREVYTLVLIDGKPLPTSAQDLPEGFEIVSASLDFDPAAGIVHFSQVTRGPGGTESSSVDREYQRTLDTVIINLCPPLALCLLRTELIGTLTESRLELTHWLGAMPRSTFRFERSGRPR